MLAYITYKLKYSFSDKIWFISTVLKRPNCTHTYMLTYKYNEPTCDLVYNRERSADFQNTHDRIPSGKDADGKILR